MIPTRQHPAHFTLDFSTAAGGGSTTEAERREVLAYLKSTGAFTSRFRLDEHAAVSRATATAENITESPWQPGADDGCDEAFIVLSCRFPDVAFAVFGWGPDVLEAWETTYTAGEAQFAAASVVTPPRIIRTGEHPTCPGCGYSGAHTVYFEPRIFKATLEPDLSVAHHGLVYDGELEPEVECGQCRRELSAGGLDLS